jgi:hypothetical protein
VNNFLDVPRASTGAISAGSRPAAGGAAGDFLQQGGARPAQLPARPGAGDRPGIANRPAIGERPVVGNPIVNRPVSGSITVNQNRNFVSNRPVHIENRQVWQGNRVQRRDEVRGQIVTNYPRMNFWSNYPGWAAWRITRPYRWATWGALAGWCSYGAVTATSYSYGDNIYYQGDQVYYGTQPAATAEGYTEQAAALVASAPPLQPDQAEWMPLGVFALTQDGQAAGPEPMLFMQLAISKQGVISGTFQNMATGQVQQLEGMAQKETQRVAWGIVGQQRPIIETGLANLTEDTAPVLIHFADGQTQQWLLVRLEEPK